MQKITYGEVLLQEETDLQPISIVETKSIAAFFFLSMCATVFILTGEILSFALFKGREINLEK